MKTYFKFTKKQTTIAAYVVLVFVICMLLAAIVIRWNSFVAVVAKVISVFSPILWGVALAYLQNPIMKFFERSLKKFVCRKKDRPKLLRIISIALTTLLVLMILFALIAAIVPQLIKSYTNLSENFSGYWDNLKRLASKIYDKNPDVYDYIMKGINDGESYITDMISKISPRINGLIDTALSLGQSAVSFVLAVADALIGFLISIYLLYSKEIHLAQARKILYSIFPTFKCDRFLGVIRLFDRTFIDFLSGKAVDSLIIGILCFIGLSILNMPYALLISVFVGVTNMVPFFGPLIGAIPCGALILLTDPIKTLWFAIFILALQQFDGNILGPKILGNKLGLPTFWILFAILIGGGLFGFAGMVVSVPIFAVIYRLIRERTESRLARKNLPVGTEAYMSETCFAVNENETEDDEDIKPDAEAESSVGAANDENISKS